MPGRAGDFFNEYTQNITQKPIKSENKINNKILQTFGYFDFLCGRPFLKLTVVSIRCLPEHIISIVCAGRPFLKLTLVSIRCLPEHIIFDFLCRSTFFLSSRGEY